MSVSTGALVLVSGAALLVTSKRELTRVSTGSSRPLEVVASASAVVAESSLLVSET